MQITDTSEPARLTLRSIDIDRDAERLAKMWRESDEQWPGTVSDGIELSAEWARQWQSRQTCLDTLVWADHDIIAGYCSIWELPDEPRVTYVATLNVVPRFQKQSLARMLLLRGRVRARTWRTAIGSAYLAGQSQGDAAL